MLTDHDIRNRLIEKLHKANNGKNYRIIEELVICDGLARADITVANGILHGYEIKSDCDTLDRLPNQVECYDKTYDKITIVIGEKFEDVIKEYVPSHWGIQIAYLNKFGNVSIKSLRPCRINKRISASYLLDLLWNSEIKVFLKQNKIHGYSNKGKCGLKKLAMDNLKLKMLRDYTRETLKTRIGWRDDLV
ncbi:sce7726 family protein [Sporolactobacillus sp. STCC-11]|uniref:sce7726 family protein n=1 Tax=Sporolactobacillus caesalpiniae TaxID=3230362 RepID=UPI003390C68A